CDGSGDVPKECAPPLPLCGRFGLSRPASSGMVVPGLLLVGGSRRGLAPCCLATSRSVSKHKLYVPKHRAPAVGAPKRIVRTTVVMSGIAVAATGATVASGVLGGSAGQVAASTAGASLAGADVTLDAETLNERARQQPVSRSGLRDEVDRRDADVAAPEPALLSA